MNYRIKTSSRYHYVLTVVVLPMILTVIMTSITGPLKYYKGTAFEYIGIAIVFGIFGLCWYLTKYTSNGELSIMIDDNGLEIKWIKNYLLYKYRDRKISWVEIKSYKLTPDRWFDIFKIKMIQGRNFIFERDSLKNNDDDFNNFFSELGKRIRKYNKDESKLHKIRNAPTLYEGLSGKILLGFTVLVMAGGFVVLVVGLFKGIRNYSSLFGLLGAMGGGLFTIITIRQMNKKK